MLYEYNSYKERKARKNKKNIKEHLDEKRYEHVKRVVKKARQLAKIHNAPIDKVEMGAYLHDVAKFFETSHMLQIIGEKYEEVTDIAYQTSELLHGFAGAEYVKEKFKITDEEILGIIKVSHNRKEKYGISIKNSIYCRCN